MTDSNQVFSKQERFTILKNLTLFLFFFGTTILFNFIINIIPKEAALYSPVLWLVAVFILMTITMAYKTAKALRKNVALYTIGMILPIVNLILGIMLIMATRKVIKESVE